MQCVFLKAIVERILIRIELRGKIDIMDTVAFLLKIIIELKHVFSIFCFAELNEPSFLSTFESSFAIPFPKLFTWHINSFTNQ